MTPTFWILTFAGTATLAYLLVGLMIRWTTKRQILAIPNQRSSHDTPKPLGGGLAIVTLTLLGGGFMVLFTSGWQRVGVVLLTAGIIAAISWWDDIQSLPSLVRLGVHAVGAAVAMAVFGYWDVIALPYLPVLQIGWLGIPITFVWIVGLTNAYNFMDGIDGLAGSQAVIAGIGWAIIGAIVDSAVLSMLGLLVAATSLGFLLHNWAPARIFMGDVGSAFLGFLFGVMPVAAAWGVTDYLDLTNRGVANTELAALMPLTGALILWPFLFDTSFTFIRRLKNGENVLKSHRQHLYQRLVITGFSHRRVTLIYIGLALVFLLLALGWLAQIGVLPLAVLLGLPLISILQLIYVSRIETRALASQK